jgi:HEAT repeat protein
MAMVLVAVSGVVLWGWRTWSPAQRWMRTIRDTNAANARWDLSMKALLGQYPSIGPDRAITELIAALSDPHRNVRADAAGALGQGGQAAERAIPALIGALNDPYVVTRANAAGSLREIIQSGARGRDAVVTALIGALGDASPTVRAGASLALGVILQPGGRGGERATAALLRMLDDPERSVRVHAAWSLIKLGRGDACIDPLIEALNDARPSTRSLAIGSLGEIGPPAKAAIPKLRAILDSDSRPYMREAAATALSRISQSDGS